MNKLSVFNHVTVDGYFAGPDGEMDWFQSIHDEEWQRYAEESAGSAPRTLMFGRATYEIMKSFWPSPMAKQMDSKMADVMVNSRKVVFSKTMEDEKDETNWKNVTVFHEIDPKQIEDLKEREDGTILGSGTVVRQLTELGLIDEYMLVVVPVLLGRGKSLFGDVQKTHLRLIESKHFASGIVLLKYEPGRPRTRT